MGPAIIVLAVWIAMLDVAYTANDPKQVHVETRVLKSPEESATVQARLERLSKDCDAAEDTIRRAMLDDNIAVSLGEYCRAKRSATVHGACSLWYSKTCEETDY